MQPKSDSSSPAAVATRYRFFLLRRLLHAVPKMSNLLTSVPRRLIPDKTQDLLNGVCAGRRSRLAVYGSGNNRVNWDKVNWGALSSQCYKRNSNRYRQTPTGRHKIEHILPQGPVLPSQDSPQEHPSSSTAGPRYGSRSAVLLRTWHDMERTENIRRHIRSMIMELSLHSWLNTRFSFSAMCETRRLRCIRTIPKEWSGSKADFSPRSSPK